MGRSSCGRLREVASIALGAVTLTAASPEAASAAFPQGFAIESVVGGPFTGDPTGFAFLPDSRVLIIDRFFATVRIAAAGSPVSVEILTIPNVSNENGEQGLLGIAVDPEWPARPYVYFQYTMIGDTCAITMYTASGDLTNPASTNLVLASPFHLLTDARDIAGGHNGGTLRFGPDGMLYSSLGDDGSACFAQNLNQLVGKILRLDVSAMPGEGTGPPPKSEITPPDNPFGPGENARLVWGWGLRNPYRFTIDGETGDLFIGDVGENLFEEVDQLTGTTGAAANFGWPVYEGFEDHGATCGETNPLTFPIYAYPHAESSYSVIAGPQYRADGTDSYLFPVGYQECVFFADFYQGWIRRLVRTGASWALADSVPGQPSAENWATTVHHIADFQLGNDGALYVLRMLGPAKGLYRIRPTSATGAPLASEAASGVQLLVAPNPAAGDETVVVRIRGAGAPVDLRIVDLAGRTVRSLLHGGNGSRGSMTWDGRADDGQRVSAGVYIVRMASKGEPIASARVVRIR